MSPLSQVSQPIGLRLFGRSIGKEPGQWPARWPLALAVSGGGSFERSAELGLPGEPRPAPAAFAARCLPIRLPNNQSTARSTGIAVVAAVARRELLATGDTVRKRTAETVSELTAQEAYIARLAVDCRTNVEIGVQLFLSTRTVEWHLSKVYAKLGVGSRRELRRAWPASGSHTRRPGERRPRHWPATWVALPVAEPFLGALI